MSGMTLVEFLLARIAEDEAQVDAAGHWDGGPDWWMPDWVTRSRLRAECETKRRIVELHRSWPVLVKSRPEITSSFTDMGHIQFQMSEQIAWATEQAYRDTFGDEPPTGPFLRVLAALYADHPDYRDEWRPGDAAEADA